MRYLTRILAWAPVFAIALNAGSITGAVTGADGSAITQGQVTAARKPDPAAPRLGSTSASTAILPDGTFQLPPLVYGAYQVCVTAPGTTWLDSCEWGQKGAVASLTPSEPSAHIAVALTKGALVTVRVNDAAQLLAANEGVTRGAQLLIGVRGDSLCFYAATTASKDSGGRNYQILIPFDRSLNISVASALFQLQDQSGRPLLPFGNLLPITVPSGQTPGILVLNVSGIAPGPK